MDLSPYLVLSDYTHTHTHTHIQYTNTNIITTVYITFSMLHTLIYIIYFSFLLEMNSLIVSM